MTPTFTQDPQWLRLVDEARELEILWCGKMIEAIQRQKALGDRSPQAEKHQAEFVRQRDRAICSRRPEVVAEIERRIDEGVGYFAHQGDLARRAGEAKAHA